MHAVVEEGTTPAVEWATARVPRPGQTVLGDIAVVAPARGGVLVVAVDGVGHGVPAAQAAQAATRAVRLATPGERGDLVRLVRRCHELLRATRGAALGLALVGVRDSKLTWMSIGGVQGRLLAAGGRLPERGSLRAVAGLPGEELPTLRPSTCRLHRGDVLLLATDGIDRRFAEDVDLHGRPAAIAEQVLARSWLGNDDALAIVARYLGGAR